MFAGQKERPRRRPGAVSCAAGDLAAAAAPSRDASATTSRASARSWSRSIGRGPAQGPGDCAHRAGGLRRRADPRPAGQACRQLRHSVSTSVRHARRAEGGLWPRLCAVRGRKAAARVRARPQSGAAERSESRRPLHPLPHHGRRADQSAGAPTPTSPPSTSRPAMSARHSAFRTASCSFRCVTAPAIRSA